MPSFEKSSPEVVARFDALLEHVPGADRRLMFGYPAAFADGYLFFSLFHDDAILRLDPADRDTFDPDGALEDFEPAPGRSMRPFVVLPTALFASDEIGPWLVAAEAAARRLPPKPPRKPRQKSG